jgi:hypothetical protein
MDEEYKEVCRIIREKLVLNFCCNPHEMYISPQRLLEYIWFIRNNLSEKYENYTTGDKIDFFYRVILNQLFEYYPENIEKREYIDYFINELLYYYLRFLDFAANKK